MWCEPFINFFVNFIFDIAIRDFFEFIFKFIFVFVYIGKCKFAIFFSRNLCRNFYFLTIVRCANKFSVSKSIKFKYRYEGDIRPKINFRAEVLPEPFIPIRNVRSALNAILNEITPCTFFAVNFFIFIFFYFSFRRTLALPSTPPIAPHSLIQPKLVV